MARVPSLFSPGSLMGASVDPFMALHREMNRLFDDAIRGGGTVAGQGGGGQGFLAPHMDVSETEKEIRIKAELPGVAENDVEVSLNDDVLTIRAEKKEERKEEREGVHLSERTFGTFQRSLRLPYQIDPEKVQAQFENGVLAVTLPKTAPQERSKRIQIQGGKSASGAGQPSGQPGTPSGGAP